MSSFPSVAEFYRGRNIFLTGGTGFIGKVFIEKMLRCCPDIGDVYVLIRPRRSQSVSERLKKMFKEKVSRPLSATSYYPLTLLVGRGRVHGLQLLSILCFYLFHILPKSASMF